MKLLPVIQRELFNSFSRVKIDPAIQGCKFKDDTLILGCQAGPNREIHNLFHEMGHMIVTSDEKVGLPSWGLNYKSDYYQDYRGCMMRYDIVNTCQDVMLELDVIGWQAIIEQHFTNRIDNALNNVKALSFLDGWIYYEYGTIKKMNINSSSGNQMKIHLGQEYVKTLVSQRSYGQFLKEWNRKCSLLETKKHLQEIA